MSTARNKIGSTAFGRTLTRGSRQQRPISFAGYQRERQPEHHRHRGHRTGTAGAGATGRLWDRINTVTTADGAKLQLWSCTGAANQKRNVPA
jgi:hypothetical protein